MLLLSEVLVTKSANGTEEKEQQKNVHLFLFSRMIFWWQK